MKIKQHIIQTQILFWQRITCIIIFSIFYCSTLTAQQKGKVFVNDNKLTFKKNSDSLSRIYNQYFNNKANNQSSRQLSPNGTITLNITTIGASCNDSNGTALISASGGTGPYQFTINNGVYFFNTGNFPNLVSGTYTVLVKDATGQTTSSDFTISNTFDKPLVATTSYQRTSSCGANTGSITLSVTGGVPPYEYSKDGDHYQSGNIFNNLYAGYYFFFVKDANGCITKYEPPLQTGYFESFGCQTSWAFASGDATCDNADGSIYSRAANEMHTFTYSPRLGSWHTKQL